jgi:hypothetical protein
VFEQPWRVARKPKEPVVLRKPLHFPSARRALALDEFRFEPERLVEDAIPPLVLAEIDIAILAQALEDALHDAFVARLRRTYEVVVLDVVCVKERLPSRYQLVRPRLRRLPGGSGRARDFLAGPVVRAVRASTSATIVV